MQQCQTFNRSKLVCDCYPERSIRVSPKQAARGPILCGVCSAEFRPQGDASNSLEHSKAPPAGEGRGRVVISQGGPDTMLGSGSGLELVVGWLG